MSTTSTSPRTTGAVSGGRHPVSVGHLVMGIAFLGLVGIWALVQSDVVGGDDLRWLLPVPWVLAGLAGLLATTLSSRGKYETRVTGWVPPAEQVDDTTVLEAEPETWPEPQPGSDPGSRTDLRAEDDDRP